MTRLSAGLEAIYPEECLEINRLDASVMGLHDRDTVKMVSRRGKVVIKVSINEIVRPGRVFTCFHFGEQIINKLTNPARDPISKIPQL